MNKKTDKVRFRTIFILTFASFCFAVVILEILLSSIESGFYIVQQLQNEKHSVSDITILALGESTTAFGTGDFLVDSEHSWPRVLERLLNSEIPDYRVRVINKGMPGADTVEILSMTESFIEEYEPQIIISMMGINDRNRLNREESRRKQNRSVIEKVLTKTKIGKLLLISWNHILKVNGFFDIAWYEAEAKKLVQIGKYSDADEVVGYGLAKDANSIELYIQKAKIWQFQGRYKEAEDVFLQALQKDSYSAGIYPEYVRLLMNMHRYDEAIDILNKGASIDPYHPRLLNEYGEYFLANEAYDDGISFFTDLLESASKGDYDCQKDCRTLSDIKQMIDGELDKLQNAASVNNSLVKKDPDIHIGDSASAYATQYVFLRDLCERYMIQLIAMQYPGRSVQELIDLLGEHSGIIFVDNEHIFNEAISSESYDAYFVDKMGGNFGHTTGKGSALIAKNVADVIIDEALID